MFSSEKMKLRTSTFELGFVKLIWQKFYPMNYIQNSGIRKVKNNNRLVYPQAGISTALPENYALGGGKP